MGRSRIDLHEELCDLLGSRNVYFQPPATVKLKYPCIIYTRDPDHIRRADDKMYVNTKRYTVTLVYFDPDSDLIDKPLEKFQLISHDKIYSGDNLYHSVYTLYY